MPFALPIDLSTSCHRNYLIGLLYQIEKFRPNEDWSHNLLSQYKHREVSGGRESTGGHTEGEEGSLVGGALITLCSSVLSFCCLLFPSCVYQGLGDAQGPVHACPAGAYLASNLLKVLVFPCISGWRTHEARSFVTKGVQSRVGVIVLSDHDYDSAFFK